MSSRHNNLKRIGEEGFRMLDQAEEKQRCLYHPTKPSVHYQQPPPVTQVQRIVTPPPEINYSQHPLHKTSFTSHQTMPNHVTDNTTTSHYNPPRRSADHMTSHVTQVTRRDQSSAGVMDCHEVARRFGGMVVTDYYPNNKKVMMQRGSKAY